MKVISWKQRLVTLVAVGAWLVAAGGPSAADASPPAGSVDIAWDRVLGANPDALDEGQKEKAAAIMNEEKVYWGCMDTIAACLEKDPDCMTARRLAGMVVRKVKAGHGADDIHDMIERRGLSMHPFKIHEIDVKGAPSIGDDDPKVKVVAFSDFECPYCRKVLPRLEKLSKKMDGVTLYFKHFPVKSHKRSVPAALASMACHEQGVFWEFHDIAYKDPKHLDDDELLEKAKEAGIEDEKKYKKALKNKKLLERIKTDKLEGLKLGVEGTPTVYINGKEYKGESTYADLKDVLSEELDLVAGKK